MLKFNVVQRKLLSLGYPMSMVKEYYEKSEYFKEEVRDYANNKKDVTKKVI